MPKKRRLIFRELFRNEEDDTIANIVGTFFDGVATRWSDAWDSAERGVVLNRTLGFSGSGLAQC